MRFLLGRWGQAAIGLSAIFFQTMTSADVVENKNGQVLRGNDYERNRS